ncbi:MAG: LysE family translocator [Lautropia sp.]|nr:LysE family translocator [Lautropia sp.]
MPIDLGLLGLYAITVIAMIATPGPVVVLVTGAGLAGGGRQALRTAIGTNVASLILILLSALVIKGLFAVDETVFTILKLAGAAYIGWIGWEVLREARAAPASGNGNGNGMIKPRVGGFGKGFVMAISNPKDIIFFASFFPQFIGVTPDTNTSIGLLTVLWIVLDFATLMTVYWLVSRTLKPSAHRWVLLISGGLMLLIGAGGIISSILALTGR